MARMTRHLLAIAAAFVCLKADATNVQAVASAQDGGALYRRDCAGCHDTGVDRAPAREALSTMTAERVLAAMESGPMLSMASRDSGAERRAIAQFLTGKTLSARDMSTTPSQAAMCATRSSFASPLP